MDAFDRFLESDSGADRAAAFMATVDPRSHVGSRHHTVPKFLLDRWADKSGQVLTYARIEERFGTRNVRDLAITDFYTFIDQENRKDSSFETLIGEAVEVPAARVLRMLLNPFAVPRPVEPGDLASLAQFAAFQVVRTTRHRRESELHAEWLAKASVSGQIPDEKLREITVTPHQNDSIRMMSESAFKFVALFAYRPVALLQLDRPRLLIGDDPVLVNPGPGASTHHHPDCFLTDDELEARAERRRRKARKGRRRARRVEGRVLHFSSTVPRGLGTAAEIVLPVSPSAVLYWGPLEDELYFGDIERERLSEEESERFADLVNDHMCVQALDWIVTRPTDPTFRTRGFPAVGPLMRVCDGENAASAAINETPRRLRPARLWQDG